MTTENSDGKQSEVYVPDWIKLREDKQMEFFLTKINVETLLSFMKFNYNQRILSEENMLVIN